jgi:hypothetical protein
MRPIRRIRAGAVKLAVWQNGVNGNEFETVIITRSYKDKNGEWKDSNSFRVSQIPQVILVLQKAYEQATLSEEVVENGGQ